jgi:hypothetical protein
MEHEGPAISGGDLHDTDPAKLLPSTRDIALREHKRREKVKPLPKAFVGTDQIVYGGNKLY